MRLRNDEQGRSAETIGQRQFRCQQQTEGKSQEAEQRKSYKQKQRPIAGRGLNVREA